MYGKYLGLVIKGEREMSNENFGACLKCPWHQHLCMKIPSCDCKATRALCPALPTIETTCCLDSSLLYWLSKVLNSLKVGGKGLNIQPKWKPLLSLWKVFPLIYSLFLSFSSSLLVLHPLVQCLPHLSIPYFF